MRLGTATNDILRIYLGCETAILSRLRMRTVLLHDLHLLLIVACICLVVGLAWSVLDLAVRARVSRVGPVDDPRSRCHMHVPTAFLSLDIPVDILNVRDHRVLAWTELVVRRRPLGLGCCHLGRNHPLLLLAGRSLLVLMVVLLYSALS